ncbi:DUF3048 domain-containing protein [Lentibacillus sp. Marseille-P4043]|uniref:DUF3048 domain-containing protein n=1 Tax=Lentibacillus sp. Marseille-P4043 TaxID=2040293 RepID=UPI000D0BB46F|nr:DUF3048 domain-containing protein [Lentibacillus sp. Marseille-P4043]
MKKVLLCTILVIFALLVGCSDDKEKAENNESKESAVEDKSDQPEKMEHVYPLTGIGTNEAANNRIVGVMINNHTNARPQTGLSKADIVFEILAEGRITRFLALFQSEKPDVVGPVRSAREYYFELADDYNALYVYHGAAAFVNDMIDNRGIEYLDGFHHDNDGKLFKRESFREAPHNSYLLFDAVYDAAEEKGYDITATYEPLPFLTKDEVAGLAGESAQHVEIDYSKNKIMEIVEFDYDADSEKYTRFNDREKTVELNTDEPIQVDNVFVVETHHEVIDDAGRRAVDMESGGDALLLQKGKVQQVQWENKDGRIIPVKNGKPVGFVPGKTWINVVPNNPGIDSSVTVSN